MKWGALLGWGIVIYAFMYLVWIGMALHGFAQGTVPRVFTLCVLIATATIAGRSLRLSTWKDILPYSVVWTVIVMLLDGIFTVPYAGWLVYFDWNLWVGYVLVALIPLFAPLTRRPHDTPTIT